MQAGLSATGLLTGAETFRGLEAVEHNAKPIKDVYNSIRTSYGPQGLDKMCVDASGFVLITNDGATILRNMLLENPVAHMLVNLALEQDKGVGDGTTSVVLLAANLILHGSKLIADGVHPSMVVSGYRLAYNEASRYIKNEIARKLEIREDWATSHSALDSIVATAISSKIISQASDHFVAITKQAIHAVGINGVYPVERINIVKSLGESLEETEFFNGYILNCTIASKMMQSRLVRPRIACLDFSMLREKLPITASIRVADPAQLEKIRARELGMTRSKCQAVIDSGATLVLTTGGIDELCIKMFIDAGVVAVRRCAKDDLETIAAATGTVLYKSMSDEHGEYHLTGLGECEAYEVRTIGGYDLVYLSGCATKLSTILIRGPNSQVADEAERALNDALQVLKRALESRSFVPGGGAVEAALSFVLEDLSKATHAREHVAIHRYSDALLELPRILAANAGLPANELVGRLLSEQHRLFRSGERRRFLGLDVISGTVGENMERGIIEPTLYKVRALRAATEAAISVLRINEVCVFPAKGRK